MDEAPKPKITHLEARIFFSVVCVLVVVARGVHPAWFDDALDYVPVALAALPWLGFFVTEVKLPGGIEAKLAALYEQVQVAEKKADAARQEAAAAKVETRMMAVAPDPVPAEPFPVKSLSPAQPGTLAQQYNAIRATRPSGSARTAAMTGIVRAMVAAAAEDPGTDVTTRASSPDEGQRLSAAAWAVAHPDSAAPAPLIDALYGSTQPFVQYWLLMALDQIADRQGRSAFSADTVNRLRGFRSHAATGTDRSFLLDRILGRFA